MDDKTPSITDAFAHHQAGRLDEAETLYQDILKQDENNFQALQLMGTLLLHKQKASDASLYLLRATKILATLGQEEKKHAVLFHNLGIALHACGRRQDAAAYFRHGLSLDPSFEALHLSLGRTLMEEGKLEEAKDSFEQAMSIDRNNTSLLCDLGTIYARLGRLPEAIEMYRKAIVTEPLHWAARFNLAQLLRRTENYSEAIGLLTKLADENPSSLSVQRQLAIAQTAAHRFDDALKGFGKILSEAPDDAESLQYLANIHQSLGNKTKADESYSRSFVLRPIITIDAIQSPPAFKALLLFAPGGGNTPLDCIIDQAPYQNNILNVMSNAVYDIDMLRRQGDVVVNLVADVDQSRDILAKVTELADRLERPVVNDPRKILNTGREAIASILKGAPQCVVPRTYRVAAARLLQKDFEAQNPLHYPFLMRPAGTHGGIDFELIEGPHQISTLIDKADDKDYYLIEYVDYRSLDGFFRKYRFIFVNDEILPYHLAIDQKWKIHHVTTDMEHQAWMQKEEETFLYDPSRTFGPQQMAALTFVRQTVGLDYFGIDCALNQQGDVVIFEVNACMLVHQHNAKFPYKDKAVSRIKSAFAAMLLQKVGRNEVAA